MGIGSWIVFGLLAGLAAHAIVPGKNPGGCSPGCGNIVVTAVIGIVGAVIGGYIGTALGLGDVQGFNLRSFLLAVAGSVTFLVVLKAIRGKDS